MKEEIVTVKNKTGLHAHPAAIIVKTAKQYQSTISFEVNGTKIDARSLMKIVAANIKLGTQVKITCNGPDEVNAAKEFKDLLNSDFDEK